MAPLILGRLRQAAAGPPSCGAPGPLEVALSLLVYRCLPLRAGAIGIGLDWLGLTGPGEPGDAMAVAARRGVSRQRVQSVLRELREASGAMPPPPSLVRSLNLLGGGPPARPAGEVAAGLVGAGSAAGPVHPAVLLRAAALFGLAPGFALRRSKSGSGTVVVSAGWLRRYDELPRRLRSTCRSRGLVRVADVGGGLPVGMVEGDPAVVVHDGWCWLRPDPSPLGRVLGRLLSVCGPLPQGQAIAGLGRAVRHGRAATGRTPAGVLLAYLSSQPAYQLDDRSVSLVEAPVRLTAADRALAAAFASRGGGQLPTGELVRSLVGAGLSPTGAHTLISFSPLLRRVRPGVQELRRNGAGW